jgi:hypothetical protein
MTVHDDDEGLHRPPVAAPERWQENLFFVCWDTGSASGLLVHVQRVPDAGMQEARVVVSVEGRVGSATFTAPFRPDGLVPEFAATPVEPFRRWRLELDGKGAEGPGPRGFFATAAAGDTVLSADLTLASTLPVADFAAGLAAVVDGLRADRAGPQMGDQQHYEQGGAWRGRLRLGDRERDVAGLFVRDHSWGVRHEHQGFRAFWTASCLDGGRLFCNAIGLPGRYGVLGVGMVVDESGVTMTDQVAATFEPTAGIRSYERATVDFGAPLSRTLTAETQLHVPITLPFSGPKRYDNNALSRVRLGVSEGFGVMEWAAELTDDEAGALGADGARQ